MSTLTPFSSDFNHYVRPEIGINAGLPPGLDPSRHRIIATHVFGWRQYNVTSAQIVQDVIFRRKIRRLVAKGERVVGELLAELAADRGLGTMIDAALDRYIDIPDAALDTTGGRNFPPNPLHEIKA